MRKISSFAFLFLVLGATSSSYAQPPSPIPKILFLGDSLTEGYGIPKDLAYPTLVGKKLNEKTRRVEILNGGISGSTSASMASRLRWFLKAKPTILFLAMGANDGLRGVSLESLEKNLDETIRLAQKEGMKVVLAGMRLPPNYGKSQAAAFAGLYPRLAKKYSLAHIPFLLEGVAGEKALNQEDSIHPNEKGHEKITAIVLPYLEKLL